MPIDDMIVLEQTRKLHRAVPPDFVETPYSCTKVRCPRCGMIWEIEDSSIKPGDCMQCGNADCRSALRFPNYGGDPYTSRPCVSDRVFCTYTSGGHDEV